MYIEQFSREFSEMFDPNEIKKFDVVVAGAGVAGCCAAIAAARTGKNVLLIEQTSGPGGVAVHCGCPVFMGFGCYDKQIVGGLGEEFLRQLDSMNAIAQVSASKRIATTLADKKELNGVYTTTEPDIALCLNRMISAAGVSRLYYTTITDVVKNGRKITGLKLFCNGRRFEVACSAVVDATGDAVVSLLAGAEVIEGSPEETMTKTVLFKVNNVRDFDKVRFKARFTELQNSDSFPFHGQDVFMGNQLGTSDEVLLNMSLVAGDALDPWDLTRMDVELREQVMPIIDWLRRNFDEFKDCRLAAIAPKIGVRGGRTAVTEEMITCQSLIDGVPVAEPIALARRTFGGHGINKFRNDWDKHIEGCRGVPYGALKVSGFDNLLVAGRAIGVEPKALSSIRLMAICMATGQAAGISAALCVDNGGFAPYAQVKNELLRQKAILD